MTERRPVPKWIQKELISIGGYADNGTLPFLRFIHPEDAYLEVFGQKVPRYWETQKKKAVAYSYVTGEEFHKFEDDGKPIYKPTWRTVKDRSEIVTLYPELTITHYDRVYTLRKFWILEAWMPPEKYKATWEAERYRWEGPIKKDMLGPPPEDGDYTCIVTLNGNFGTPKDIGRKALDYVRRIWKKMLDDPMWNKTNWRDKPTEEMYERARKEEEDALALGEAKEADLIHEVVKDVLEPAQRWIFGKEKSITFGNGKTLTAPTGLVDQHGKPLSSQPST